MTSSVPSQQVQAKAGRLLLDGKVRIDYADQRAFTALVTGSRPYHVLCVDGRWRCDCPATTTCAHELACQTVWKPAPVVVPEPDAFDLIGSDLGQPDGGHGWVEGHLAEFAKSWAHRDRDTR